jgi:hypothetical protein
VHRRTFIAGSATLLAGCGIESDPDLFNPGDVDVSPVDGGTRVEIVIERNGQARNVRVELNMENLETEDIFMQTVVNDDSRTVTFLIEGDSVDEFVGAVHTTNPNPDVQIRDLPVKCYGSESWCSQFSEPES